MFQTYEPSHVSVFSYQVTAAFFAADPGSMQQAGTKNKHYIDNLVHNSWFAYISIDSNSTDVITDGVDALALKCKKNICYVTEDAQFMDDSFYVTPPRILDIGD